MDHRRIDERSLAFGRAIAAHLMARPELIEHARGNLERWLKTGSEATRPALLEWRAALDGPLDGVVSLLTGTADRSRRLRQSNPFAGVLTQQERNSILLAFGAHDESPAA
jgi:hypothetical protein